MEIAGLSFLTLAVLFVALSLGGMLMRVERMLKDVALVFTEVQSMQRELRALQHPRHVGKAAAPLVGFWGEALKKEH